MAGQDTFSADQSAHRLTIPVQIHFEPDPELLARIIPHPDTTLLLPVQGIVEYEPFTRWLLFPLALMAGLVWWPMRRPVRLKFSPTTKLLGAVEPEEVHPGKRYRIETGSGGITIDARKRSAWAAPGSVVLTVSADEGVDVAVADVDEVSNFTIHPLGDTPYTMGPPGYILWRSGSMPEWPRTLSATNVIIRYPGYEVSV